MLSFPQGNTTEGIETLRSGFSEIHIHTRTVHGGEGGANRRSSSYEIKSISRDLILDVASKVIEGKK